MSISQMNVNVATDAYVVKEAKKKAPAEAGVQPREEAPTITPSTPDVVDIKKDDASATTPATDGSSAPPAKQTSLLVPALAGLGGGGIGVGATYAFSGEDETKGSKAQFDDGKFKTKGEEYKVTGKESVEHKGFTYKVKLDSDNNATIDTITGTVKGGTFDYEFEKKGRADAVLTKKIEATDPFIKKLVPAGAAGTPAPVAVDYHVEVKGDQFTLKPAVATNNLHPQYEGTIKEGALTLKTAVKPNEPLFAQGILDEVKTALDGIKLGEAHKEFKAFSQAKLSDMIHLEGGSRNWPLIGGIGVAAAALTAGATWFFTRKKPEQPTSEPQPAS